MNRLAELSIRHPRRVLALWLAFAAAMAFFAFGVADQLSPSKTVIAGTESARAHDLAEEEFGPSVLVPILLQGPAAQVDRQGRGWSWRCAIAATRESCRHGIRSRRRACVPSPVRR